MLDFGKLVQRFEDQIHSRRGEYRREMQKYAAVSFRMKGEQVYLPPFANVDDVLVMTQVQRTDRDRQPGRIFTDIDTFTAKVTVENGHLIVGSAVLRHRNLGRRPMYQQSAASYCASESPALFEALELDYARAETCRAVADGTGFAAQTVPMPQLMALVETLPEKMRTIPIPPSVSGLAHYLIQKAELKPEMGPPLGWYLDLRAWRGRQFDNELGLCLPMIANPLKPIVNELFPSGLTGTNLMELANEQQELLAAAVDERLPDVPDAMIMRAMTNYLAPVRVVPGYGVSPEDAIVAARRHLGLYSLAATDADILFALENPEIPMTLSSAPGVQTFHWVRNEDRFVGGAYDFQFVWDVSPGKRATTLGADKSKGQRKSKKNRNRDRQHGAKKDTVWVEPTNNNSAKKTVWAATPGDAPDIEIGVVDPLLMEQPEQSEQPRRRSKPSKRQRLARRRAAAAAAGTANGGFVENAQAGQPEAESAEVSEQFTAETNESEKELVGVGCESEAVVSPA